MFWTIVVSKSAALLKTESVTINCWKIKLVIYQSNYFLNLNTDESVSTVLIKNGSTLHFNHLYEFWSSSLLSQLELFKIIVIRKSFFNLIKLSVFCSISFCPSSVIFSFLLFASFVFTGVWTFASEENCPRYGLGLGLGFEEIFPWWELS